MDGAAHALPILGTKVAGHHNARAQRHAVDKAGQEKDQTAGGADSGQSLAAQEVADDEGVGCIVQLLEKVADKNRQRKQQHAFCYTALGQGRFLLGFHSVFPTLLLFAIG